MYKIFITGFVCLTVALLTACGGSDPAFTTPPGQGTQAHV